MAHSAIDLHQFQSQICVVSDEGPVLEQRVATRPERLRSVLAPFRGSPVLIEASTESEWVARCLEEDGHTVIVADPNCAWMYGAWVRHTKTDRRDARVLAEACRLGAYRPAHRVSDAQRAVRNELAIREALVRERTRHIALVRSLVRATGGRIRSGDSRTLGRRFEEAKVPSALAEQVQPVLRVITTLTTEIEQLDRRLERRAEHDQLVTRLRTVPGVGALTALAFIAALDDVRRFRDADQVASYLGLVPRESSSGERRHRGAIHKAGQERVRWLLVEAAWRVVLNARSEASAPLRAWTARLAGRRGRTLAVVALARRLAGILFAVWRDGTEYRSEQLGKRGPA